MCPPAKFRVYISIETQLTYVILGDSDCESKSENEAKAEAEAEGALDSRACLILQTINFRKNLVSILKGGCGMGFKI